MSPWKKCPPWAPYNTPYRIYCPPPPPPPPLGYTVPLDGHYNLGYIVRPPPPPHPPIAQQGGWGWGAKMGEGWEVVNIALLVVLLYGNGSYPTGYSKDQKRSFRRKAKLNFRVKSGVLYYYASSVSAEERRWRRVITAEESHRVITSVSCHASAEGKHRGDICWSSH